MTSRSLIAAATLAIAAGCTNPRPGTTPAVPPVCEPLPLTTQTAAHEVAAAPGASLVATEAEWIMRLTGAEYVSVDFMADPAKLCAAGGACGPQLPLDRMQALDLEFLKVTPIAATIGQQVVSLFPIEGGLIITWPRDALPDPVIRDLPTLPGSPRDPGAPTFEWCPGCVPCLPGHCNSLPPTRPYLGGLHIWNRCNCDAVREQYCADGGVPINAPEDCPCVDACCAPPASP